MIEVTVLEGLFEGLLIGVTGTFFVATTVGDIVRVLLAVTTNKGSLDLVLDGVMVSGCGAIEVLVVGDNFSNSMEF